MRSCYFHTGDVVENHCANLCIKEKAIAYACCARQQERGVVADSGGRDECEDGGAFVCGVCYVAEAEEEFV